MYISLLSNNSQHFVWTRGFDYLEYTCKKHNKFQKKRSIVKK